MSKNPFMNVACCTSKTRRSGALIARAKRSCGLIDAKVASSVPYEKQIIITFTKMQPNNCYIFIFIDLKGRRVACVCGSVMEYVDSDYDGVVA